MSFIRITWLALAVVTLFSVGSPLSGATTEGTSVVDRVMGTNLALTVVGEGRKPEDISADIEAAIGEVRAVETMMSSWDEESEVSQLNRLGSGEVFRASPQLAQVLRLSLQVSRLTGGGFDMTVLPLVKRWGFIRKPGTSMPFPSDEEINKLHERVGWQRVSVDAEGNVRFAREGVVVDLGGIAKGYGVDVAFLSLRKKGYENILVEIGGETRSAGRSPLDRPWRIGINNPKPEPAKPYVAIVRGADMAVATSGDYEDFFFHEGKRYSHVIDPITGRPVRNGVCSATVIAKDCTFADALATGLMVLGAEKGLSLVNAIADTEALIAVRNADDTVSLFYSAGIKTLLLDATSE